MSKWKEISYSTHHILPSSMGWASNDVNLVELRTTTHRAIHTLFQNQMFAQQLLTMTNLNAQALRKDVVEQLLEILDSRDMEDPTEWYKLKAIR